MHAWSCGRVGPAASVCLVSGTGGWHGQGFGRGGVWFCFKVQGNQPGVQGGRTVGMRGVAVGSGLQPQSAWCPELLASSVRDSGGEGCGFALKSQATNLGSKEEGRWGCVALR